ncbi:OmpA/MotB domain-containing protein [Oceaniovalibus guishaninsula JLT2003]|uniref:OmpA/MotB domain-containing protein n=2 Tax=Oceaniovalibus TaxID=1207070 RepID=K2HF05_9RHOB|nr:OmpA/MotB domain-containing protein [Oceaniovalibus guishaninsula JLT2003]
MEDATGTEPDADDEQTETIADKNGDEEPVETPQAAAVAADSDSAGDVETEVIAEDDVRTSDQDFATAISNDEDADDDDDGLSNLEKALLLGAGAVAVGALLSNNRQVVARSDDRIVVSDPTGGYQLLKDDNALLRQPGNEVRTETFDDGSTRTTITREDGSRIVTIRDNELRVLQRSRIAPDGTETLLIDDTAETRPVNRAALTATAAAPSSDYRPEDLEGLRSALAEQGVFDRSYSLSQVRRIAEVRRQVPAVDLDNITFQTASAAITPEQADELASLGRFIRDSIEDDPSQVFLVEGHTDAVGDAAYNLALSDRRAESVALALTEYFNVPPENLVVQGYGEQFLRIDTQEAERANRRATIRNITPLLRTARND